MSDPNISDYEQGVHRFNPQPDPPREETETMSTGETLTSIFFEPGRVFEALRTRPRFLIAGLIILAALVLYTTLLYQHIGYENFIRSAIESSPQAANMSAEQKERAIAMQTGPAFRAFNHATPLIGGAIFIAAGGALYLLGAMAMARSISYKQALAVWTYSSFPPTVITTVLNLVLLFLKSPDDYDPVQAARRGLVRANLGLLVDQTAHPILATALGAFDLLSFYGLFLAAIGLRKVARLSSASAWGIILTIWLLGVLVRIAFSAILGGPM